MRKSCVKSEFAFELNRYYVGIVDKSQSFNSRFYEYDKFDLPQKCVHEARTVLGVHYIMYSTPESRFLYYFSIGVFIDENT